ncbi:uncharacterized protein N7484_002999 [Penicillium longicatenatum]|uniref:uncharacterized protein n=1 Tax=Penicillium longicatenatum TaxID=1561947 RepID=UPI0025486BB8|nr:uncharacterized protein N7484_002999 [Penicillium longicatenatum]KAJ5649276.1 hypothetical protein N7484_002999 [Penicillium longicatenatum]
MGFKFAFLGDLLSSLEANRTAKAASANRKDEPDYRTIAQWFNRHDRHINHPETDRLALLSSMFPERRPDRVYWLQATSLTRVIGRCLGLGSSRISELDQWRKPGGPDLGQCVENVMRQAENDQHDREVSVEEVDEALNMIASRCRFSGPQVRRQHTAVDVDTVLSSLYRRLTSRDAKWLTRMILKSYGSVTLPENYTLERFHFLLPQLLQFQNTFKGALEMLSSEPMNHFPPRPDRKLAASLCATALDHIRPRTGIKVGRPDYFKARSIKHCLQISGRRRMSIERKYDGEYCQIHIDFANKHTPIQIFSKSGKDSTSDRSGIMSTVEESLHIGSPQCKFTQRCILEGELLVWSDKRGEIADFHKLRKFLSRSGTLIGIDSDSPPQPYEHLMIVFYDILLLDDDVCLRKPHRERRLILENMVHTIHGRSAIAEQEILDLDQPESYRWLEARFSNAITRRWEGLVLKACDEPYFSMCPAGVNNSSGRWIKLKKDYIPGLGDTVDLVLIGGFYEATDAAALRFPKRLSWTNFLVACLLNKEDVLQSRELPRFRVIDVVGRHCMHRNLMESLNQFGEFCARDPEDFHDFKIDYGHDSLPKVTKIFKKPFVVELMGSGFEKPSGARYYTLRFPRIIKIHTDRGFEDAASFRELQILAEETRSVPTADSFEEREHWCKRLKVGSGLNEYIVQRSKSPPSRSSSIEADFPEPQTPVQTGNDEVLCLASLPSSPIHQPSSRSTSNQRSSNFESHHALYIDETLLPIDLENSLPEANVLTENNNLSQRQKSSQKDTHYVENPAKITNYLEGRMNGPAATSLISIYEEVPVQHKTLGATPIKSPLTTIPIYMSSKSKEKIWEIPGDAPLHDFLTFIGSDKTMTALSESNPSAASKGMAFGIVLVNIAERSLGREIHRAATAVSLATKQSSCPPKGMIFFLDSHFLEQDICSEDIKYCLRNTWAELGKLFYYACLRWDVSQTPPTQLNRLASGDAPDSAEVQYRKVPAPLVSFDQDEILALGDYVSIKPPLLFAG